MDGHIPDEGQENISSIERLVLPADLEALSVTRFDDLVAREELIYEPSTAETITDQGFAVSFCQVLGTKGKATDNPRITIQ